MYGRRPRARPPGRTGGAPVPALVSYSLFPIPCSSKEILMPTTSSEAVVVRLRITCVNPPGEQYEGGETEFGLQDKQQIVHAGHRRPDGSLVFDFDLSVKRNPDTGAIRWQGPYVNGTPAAPFIYLSWAKQATAPSRWIKRLKISLSSITSEQIEAATGRGAGRLEARVSGEGSATVPLLDDGWTVKQH